MTKPVCAIIGVGPGNGVAIAKKFSEEGYHIALCSRSLDKLTQYAQEFANAKAYHYDACDTHAPLKVFAEIENDLGPITTLVYNAGSGVFGNIDSVDVETLQKAWEINCRGLFQAVKAVLPSMRQQGGGNIVVIGATASLRGGANFTAFASSKAAQRSLAQSIAKTIGQDNIHVSYLIIDGVINIQRTRDMMPNQPDEFFLQPNDIAQSVYFVTQQPKSAWTFEMDVRPFGENW